MTRQRVLVTGAGGFIGSHLVDDQLRRGRAVTAFDLRLDRLEHQRGNTECTLVTGDIRDETALSRLVAGSDLIFHLASAHLEVTEGESYFWDVNVRALERLLACAVTSGVKRFVHTSSVGVYGPLHKLPATEETACHPKIAYEKSKLEGEEIVRARVHTGHLAAVILRPAWVYGPRCPRTLKLFRTIHKRRFVMLGSGATYRHPVYIADILQAFELAASQNGVEGETYIIAGEKAVSLAELVAQIIDIQNLEYKPLRLPLATMWPICAGMEMASRLIGREPPFSTRSLKFFTESSAFDIGKARAGLGFSPNVDLHTGLAETYRHYRRNALI